MIEHEIVKGSMRDYWLSDLSLTEEEMNENRCKFVYDKIGLSYGELVTQNMGARGEQDDGVSPNRRKITGKGWELFTDIDDYSVAIYKDGKPITGFYESTRGGLYQSGAYFVEDDSYWFTHNLLTDDEGEPKWEQEQGDKVRISAEIAHDWLTGEE